MDRLVQSLVHWSNPVVLHWTRQAEGCRPLVQSGLSLKRPEDRTTDLSRFEEGFGLEKVLKDHFNRTPLAWARTGSKQKTTYFLSRRSLTQGAKGPALREP